MLTVLLAIVIIVIIAKELNKVKGEKKSRDAVRADLSIIELNACKLREDLYSRGNTDYDTVNRLYQIETLAKGLQASFNAGIEAKKK